jgi:hypothetical protein
MQTVVIQFFQPSPQQAAAKVARQAAPQPDQPAVPAAAAQSEAEVTQAVRVILQLQAHHKVTTVAQMQVIPPTMAAAAAAARMRWDKQVPRPKAETAAMVLAIV